MPLKLFTVQMCVCARFSQKKSSFPFLLITSPGLPQHLWTVCGAGSYMLRWRPPGSLLPFVTCPRGFLQRVKRFRSASLHPSVLTGVSSAAQMNVLTSTQNVSQCLKPPQVNFQAPSILALFSFLITVGSDLIRISLHAHWNLSSSSFREISVGLKCILHLFFDNSSGRDRYSIHRHTAELTIIW